MIVAEVLFILCQKLQNGQLSQAEHAEAIEFLMDYMTLITTPSGGDASLLPGAEEIRSSYGCSRSSDGLYIALAEQLAQSAISLLNHSTSHFQSPQDERQFWESVIPQADT